MKQKTVQLFIQLALKSAPHKVMEKIASISYGIPYQFSQPNTNKDEAFIDLFIYNNTCQYITDPNFRLTRNLKGSQFQFFGETTIAKKNQKLKRSESERKLLSTIKMLNQNKNAFAAYSQAEETIILLSSEEAHKNKKYLVYIYKWILNQRSWGSEQLEKLSKELRETVVGKIYEGHEKQEEQKKVKEELEAMRQKITIKFEIEKQKQKQKQKNGL